MEAFENLNFYKSLKLTLRGGREKKFLPLTLMYAIDKNIYQIRLIDDNLYKSGKGIIFWQIKLWYVQVCLLNEGGERGWQKV
jgi:hypothetical protein